MVEDVGFNFGKLLGKCLTVRPDCFYRNAMKRVGSELPFTACPEEYFKTLPGDDFTNEEMDLRQNRPLLYANVAR